VLAESATNPRKFDAKSIEELAASFKTKGILAPLLARELEESKYEVVAGGTSPQSGGTGGTRKTSHPPGSQVGLEAGVGKGLLDGTQLVSWPLLKGVRCSPSL
jgi:hypothetical protein